MPKEKEMKVMKSLVFLLFALAFVTVSSVPVKADSNQNCAQVASALKILDKYYPTTLNHTDLLNAALKGLEEKLKSSKLEKINFKPISGGKTSSSGVSEPSDSEILSQYYADETEALKAAKGQLTKCDFEFAATDAMLQSVNNSHVFFISPKELKQSKEEQTGEIIGGIGIVIAYIDGGTYVFDAIPNDPAAQAGIRKFDRILKVDGFSLIGLPKDKATKEAANRILGKIGTKVILTIKRPMVANPFTVTITRAKANFYPVEYALFPKSIGYIKVSTFYNNTVALNFASSIDILMRYKLKGLVIDLRGNSGGYLNQLIAMLDLLLPPGTILFGMTSKNESQIITTDSAEYYGQKATKTTNTFNIPIAVLTDGGSASASEVFASAIKEHLRGITVGEKTAGALEVALTFPLPDDAAMEVTTFFISMPMADGQFQ
ncbi:S41 family peptidase, partial [Patescibacteria group bacterium]|nr:S41 family peptidase [Patescibacteria group bacterium]